MKNLCVLLLFCLFSTHLISQEERNILLKESAEIGLEKNLVTNFSELGYPKYDTCNFWNTIPEGLKKKYIEQGEKYLEYNWPTIKATDYLEIIRSGDRRHPLFVKPQSVLTACVMAELMEGKGRFIDQIINGAWFYSEQTWWGWSAHIPEPDGLPDKHNPSIDLGVGEVANILSWTYYFFKEEFDKVHPLISKRLKDEVMDKAIIPYYEREDFWWMGFDKKRKVNNWNPWTNFNMLTAILIMENDERKKIAGVQKVVRSLDIFLNQYPADGGCDEGPSYWGLAGAKLYQNLDLLRLATQGQFDVFDNQLVKNMGAYIYKANIDYPYFVNFADADAKVNSKPQVIYSYGKAIKDPVMQKFGAFLANEQGWEIETLDGKINEQVMQLMLLEEIKKATAENALIRDFWLSDIEVAGARDAEGTTDGFFFAAKGGHNAESHNHNDMGSFVLYVNGKPCLVDVGRETYNAKTFSNKRYEIWTMQSQYHNLPKINGVDQMNGSQYIAQNTSFTADKKKAFFSTDISSAYVDAGVNKWVRSYQLNRGKKFTVFDTYELSELRGLPSTINFMTPCKVSEKAAGILSLQGDGFKVELKYNPSHVSPVIEFHAVEDEKLKKSWPEGLTRIVFTTKGKELKGENQFIIKEVE